MNIKELNPILECIYRGYTEECDKHYVSQQSFFWLTIQLISGFVPVTVLLIFLETRVLSINLSKCWVHFLWWSFGIGLIICASILVIHCCCHSKKDTQSESDNKSAVLKGEFDDKSDILKGELKKQGFCSVEDWIVIRDQFKEFEDSQATRRLSFSISVIGISLFVCLLGLSRLNTSFSEDLSSTSVIFAFLMTYLLTPALSSLLTWLSRTRYDSYVVYFNEMSHMLDYLILKSRKD